MNNKNDNIHLAFNKQEVEIIRKALTQKPLNEKEEKKAKQLIKKLKTIE
jgi:hypothetical protein